MLADVDHELGAIRFIVVSKVIKASIKVDCGLFICILF